MNWLRVCFAGGVTSYRALFGWISPWVFVPILIVYPLFQILFFVYLGRSAGVGSDTFFLIGNSFVAAAITGLFGMGHAIAGERRFQTLPILLASPADRLAVFLGRAVPAVVNGFGVAALSFGLGAWILGLSFSTRQLAGLALALLVTSFACAALGLCVGALGLRGRSVSAFADSVGAAMLVVSGANVPLEELPGAVTRIASVIPLTHGIEAARHVVGGGGVTQVGDLLVRELAVGGAYLVAGLILLHLFEQEGRRSGSFDRF